MTSLVLNQYRTGSSYKDVIGKTYHFPTRHIARFSDLPVNFLYYEPRDGGSQVYFGAGRITSIYEDTEDVSQTYADVSEYIQFANPVDFYSFPSGGTWEDAKNMRNSVRKINDELFLSLLIAAKADLSWIGRQDFENKEALSLELATYPPPGKRSNYALRRIRRILETYERPGSVTNLVKRQRSYRCQLCNESGFIKRDGVPYCELHHLFHLAEDPPPDCLSPEYVVVLCANCHRKMHYGKVGKPRKAERGWIVEIDGRDAFFETITK